MKSLTMKSEHKSQRSFHYNVENKAPPGSFRFEYRIKHFFKTVIMVLDFVGKKMLVLP